MISQLAIGFAITALSFSGQQFGKEKEWKRQQEENRVKWEQQQAEKERQNKLDVLQSLCEKKDICGPAIDYATPAKPLETPASVELIGPPEPTAPPLAVPQEGK